MQAPTNLKPKMRGGQGTQTGVYKVDSIKVRIYPSQRKQENGDVILI